MKKVLLTIALAVIGCFMASAQESDLIPGIYTLNQGGPVALRFETAAVTSWGGDDDPAGPRSERESAMVAYSFRKKNAPVQSDGKAFELVCNMEKKAAVQTLKKYDIFIKTTTPDNMMILPLEVVRNRRVYDGRKNGRIRGLEVDWVQMPFTWERITDNSFRIDCDLPAGEYAIVFRYLSNCSYKFDAAYTFSVK